MKSKSILLFCLAFSLTLSGCTNNSNKIETEATQQELENENRVESSSAYDPTQMNLHYEIVNSSDHQFVFGTSFSLEYKKTEGWYNVEMKEEFAFDMLAHLLEAGERVNVDLDLKTYYFPLEKGEYRLVKIFSDEMGSYKIGILFEVVQ